MQLDKRVFDKALGTHTLPFQSCFHNRRAQLHRSTLTKLYQSEPLIPLQHRESHPTHSKPALISPAVTQCLTLMEAAPPPRAIKYDSLTLILLWSSWKWLRKSNRLFFCNGCKKSILESWAVWWLWLDSHSQMSSVKTRSLIMFWEWKQFILVSSLGE